MGGFTRAAPSTRGGGSGEAGSGGRRPATAPGGKEREARRKKKDEAWRQKAYHGRGIPGNVTQKVYRVRVIVSDRGKSGCMIRAYCQRVG